MMTIFRSVLGLFPTLAKSRFVQSTLILIALAAVIWFLCPQIKYADYTPFAPVVNRMIAIGVLVFLWGLNNIWLARNTARTKRKAEPAQLAPADPVDAEIAFQRQSFLNVMTTIREKWTGKENTTRSLYALPWYLVLGPGPSGKTSLIVNADLKFPLAHLLGEESPKNIRATNFPQYWVTSESVLFDLSGNWIKQERGDEGAADAAAEPGTGAQGGSEIAQLQARMAELQRRQPSREARLWRAFMDLLVEHRPRRPINGIILCLDVAQLIRAGDSGRGNLASAIHSRLVELSEKLGTRFTVYVVLTKLDHLAGFRDYFALLSKANRAAPFGFSFKVHPVIDADKWADEFDTQYRQFMERVNDDLIDRLYEQREPQTRRNIYGFTRELAALGPIVLDFLRRALHADRFSTPPLVRGIYLGSARQEGVPFDALLTRISREYLMQPPIMRAYSGQSVPHFLAELFQRAIFPEAGLAGDNQRVENRKRFAMNSSVAAGILATLTLAFFLNEAMQDNVARADRVVARSQDFIALPKNPSRTGDAAALLPALNEIRAATEEYPGWRNASDWRHYVTLYQGKRVGQEVEIAYDHLLSGRYLPVLADRMKQRIAALGATPETAESNERFETLRTYLLLGDREKRAEIDGGARGEGQAERTILAWFQNDWQGAYPGDDKAQAGLAAHLTHALDVSHLAGPEDQPTIEAARTDLRRVPLDLRLYRSLEVQAKRVYPSDVSFRNEIGPGFDIVFKQHGETPNQPSDILIPRLFTKNGFLDFFVPKNDAVSVVAVEDAWVTGERDHVAFSPEDLENFRKKIRQRYSSLYIDTWTNALSALEIVDFESVDHAVAVLDEINGPANPLGRVLGMVKAQSEIYDVKPAADDGKVATALPPVADDNRAQGLRINRAFSRLDQLITPVDKDKPYFEELQAALQKLEIYMRDIKTGIDSNKPVALERAIARANLAGDDPIYVLRRMSTNLPEPLNKQITHIADESWKVILFAAKKDLHTLWQTQVYKQYAEQLAPRYPFNRESSDDVSLDEFQDFFGPKGRLETFYAERLKTFLNPADFSPVVIDGRTMPISPVFIEQLRRVRQIRDVYFDASGAPNLRYSLEPVSLSSDAARAVLNIEGQLVPYSHGPTRPTEILWPNALSSKQNQSQLTVFGTGGGGPNLTFQGPWSDFRLMQKASFSGGQPGSVDVTFNVGTDKVQYRLRVAAPENPIQTQPLAQLKLPDSP